MNRLVCVAVLASCDYRSPSALEVDAPLDPTCTSFASRFDTCALPAGEPVTLAGNLTFDTNTGELFAGATPIDVVARTIATPGGEVKMIVASDVEVADGATLRATGARAFGIVASGAIRFAGAGVIDVSAGGAGARTSCDATAGANRDGGAGGGGGGGFGGAGGTGGGGDGDATTPSVGGVGGAAVALPTGPIGGCPGNKGGDDDNDGGGDGGRGGGAVYFVAARSIEMVAAQIDAGGEGGRGGHQHGLFNGDAGGGGSGGMIILEAPVVNAAGALAANGGGGGEGSGAQAAGKDGARGVRGTAPAIGGNGNSGSGSDGADGGAKLDRAGGSVLEVLSGAGGGGGGGAGFIVIEATMQAIALASPAPS